MTDYDDAKRELILTISAGLISGATAANSSTLQSTNHQHTIENSTALAEKLIDYVAEMTFPVPQGQH